MKFFTIAFLLIASIAQAATVTLTWDVNTDGVTVSYTVFKSIGGVVSTVGTTLQPAVTISTPREAPGTTVNYYVTAKSSQGLDSGPSNVVTDTVPPNPTLPLPTQVSNLTGTVSVSGGMVTQTLTWSANAPAELVTQYIVRRYDVNNVLIQSLNTTGTAVQMSYAQATMRTDVVAMNATGSGPVRSFAVTSPRVPWNARITVTN